MLLRRCRGTTTRSNRVNRSNNTAPRAKFIIMFLRTIIRFSIKEFIYLFVQHIYITDYNILLFNTIYR